MLLCYANDTMTTRYRFLVRVSLALVVYINQEFWNLDEGNYCLLVSYVRDYGLVPV